MIINYALVTFFSNNSRYAYELNENVKNITLFTLKILYHSCQKYFYILFDN